MAQGRGTDITEQQAVTPPSFGRWQGLAQSLSCLDSCRASVCGLEAQRGFGLCVGLCSGDCWQLLSVPIRTAFTCSPLACLAQAAGAPRGARAAAQVSCVGTRPPGWPWGELWDGGTARAGAAV